MGLCGMAYHGAEEFVYVGMRKATSVRGCVAEPVGLIRIEDDLARDPVQNRPAVA